MKFFNVSNHASKAWSDEQRAAATELVAGGEIIDVTFPNVPSAATTEEVIVIAARLLDSLASLDPRGDAVWMIQGEFTLTTSLVNLVQSSGDKVVAACSERVSLDMGDGKKVVSFRFVQFRGYPKLHGEPCGEPCGETTQHTAGACSCHGY
jgi:hypothetical protein